MKKVSEWIFFFSFHFHAIWVSNVVELNKIDDFVFKELTAVALLRKLAYGSNVTNAQNFKFPASKWKQSEFFMLIKQ